MSIKKSLLISGLVLSFHASAASASADIPTQAEGMNQLQVDSAEEQNILKFYENEIQERNSVDALNSLKEETEVLGDQVAISKNGYDHLVNEIDNRINEVTAFEQLPLEKKREKIVNDFKTKLKENVAAGNLYLTEEEQNSIIANYTEKVENWDGRGNFNE